MRFKKILMSMVFLALTVSGALKAQVTADFVADDVVVCPGVPIVFTNLSTYPAGSSPTYLWSFPSGFASSLTEANPTVYYYTPGTYTVTLTTTVAGTGSDIETKTAYITIVTPPDAAFTYDIPDVCNQMVVDFTNTSTAGTAAITSYLWDFGDASFSTATNPVKTYTTENTFTVILFITDGNGCTDNATANVTTLAPVTSAISSSGSLFSCGTTLTPTISATTSEGTAPYSYSWDYGNGTTSTLASSVVTYTDCGTYDITYTVTDALGCSLTHTYNDYVNVSCPEADFSMSTDTICTNDAIAFTNLSDPGATSFYWQFNYPSTLSVSSLENPTNTFTAAGTRIISLTTTYPGGCTASHLDTVEVLPKPSFTSFAATDTFGCETPFTTSLWPVGVTGTAPFSYLWEVGGMTSTDSLATFTLTEAINYTVTLTITDANGCSTTLASTGFIKIKKPVHDISASPVEGCAPLLVTFTNSSSSLWVPLDYFVWDYDDGTTDTTYSIGSHNHVFTDAGTYNVTMTLYTIDGCPKTDNIFVYVGLPVANFTILNDEDPTCNPVEIDNLSFGSDVTTIDWGDGTTTTLTPGTLDTSHVYPAGDTTTYIITLTADDRGCISTWTDTISILPIVTVVSSSWNCSNPLEFYFEVDTSIVTGDFCWDFGSGDTLCNQVSVSYTYPGPGTYSGEITSPDPIEYEGCTLSTEFSALVPDNDFSFTALPIDGCGDFDFSITSNVSPDFPSVLSYTWDIGPSSITGYTDVINDVTDFMYTFPGEDAYPVLMTIADSNGCVYTALDTIVISGAVASFTVDSIVGCSPFTVYLSDASTLIDDAGGDISIESYVWNFGAGGCPTYYGIAPPPCTFASGSHNITLTITDNAGCTFSYTEEISVTGDVTADFIADSLACNSAEPLYFSNTSSGDIADVLWDFGDGSTSTDYSALHPYAAAGTYTISLTVSDVFGCSDTHTETIGIVIDSIYADFDVTYLTSASCPPIPLQLNNASTGDYLDFWWEVERETGVFTYTLDTIILTYTIPGDYDVSIYVTGATGCIDTLTVPDALDIPGPTGEMIYSPIMDCTPAEITFEFSDLSADLSYVDFGDGDTVLITGDMTYDYAVEGVYCPTLILIDASGCSFQIECDSSITIYQTHNIDISVSDTGLCLGETLTLYNASTGSPLNPIEGYVVDFGDGTPPVPYTSFDSITYTYTTSGTYLLNVVTMSDVACGDTVTYEIEIYPTPSGLADITPYSGCAPLDVNFTITDITADIAILDYGDGNTDTITGDITYTYTDFGSFEPVLTLINGGACELEITFDESVDVYFPPVAGLIVPDTIACSGEQLIFINNSTDTVFNPIVNYTLDFGDGTTAFTADAMDTVYHSFITDGAYISTFIVENNVGCTDTLIINTYADQLPEGALAISPLEGCVPLDVTFNVIDLMADEAIIDYGDGVTDTITGDVIHTYTSPGDFTPVFYLNNANGCNIILTYETINVELIPVAGFTIADSSVCFAESISLINSSSDTAVSPITAYAIHYGDGTIDMLSDFDTVTYTYSATGIYDVTLIAQNSAGCRDTIIHSLVVNEVPSAVLEPTPAEGCIPLDVTFSFTTFSADEMILHYGDGMMDTISDDIVHSYTSAGDFIPVLYLSNNTGCFDSIILENIYAGISPIADFDISDSTVCLGESVTLYNTSWDTIWSPISSLEVDFGDGVISTSASLDSLVHDYAAAGTYSISMVVLNDFSCSDTISKTVSVGEVPSASVSLDPLEGCIPLLINFDFDAIAADDIVIDFGDGNMDTVAGDITYTYTSAGDFIPMITLLNDNGCDANISVPDVIHAGITPIADFSITDSAICFGEDIEIVNNAWDTIISPITAFTVDFGDGSVSTYSTLSSLTHNYSTTGDFIITLSVENDLGCSSEISKSVSVGEVPSASVSLDPLEGCIPLLINFDFDAIAADDIVIDFGDGNMDTVAGDITYTYTSAGDFIPVITLLNDNGCDANISVPDVIHAGITPIADFSITDSAICFGEDIEIVNNAWDTIISPITAFTVDFGDGSVSTYSTLSSLTHNYSTTGDFIITLSVENDLGCSNEISKSVSVGEVPSASVSIDPLEGCIPLLINFDFDAIAADDIVIDFGDGNMDTVAGDITYTYTSAGDFIPMITLLNDNGCDANISVPDVIHAGITPIADFFITDSAICFGEDIEIVNNAWDTIISPITAFTVDFGDGSVSTYSTLSSLTHNYSTTGDFIITLSVENDLGCSSEIFKPVTINENPSALIEYIPAEGCYPLDVFFDITDITADSAYLDFGDGSGEYITSGVNHEYTTAGTYTPQLILNNITGCSSIITDTDPIHVAAPPAAVMYFSDSTICAGESISIYNISTDTVDAPITAFELDYGDGTAVYSGSDFDVIEHVYTTEGTYLVELTVTNSLGCESTQNIPVSIAAIPSAEFDVEPVVGCGTLISTFNIISSSADSLFLNTGTELLYVTSSSINYLYNTPGVYIPELLLLNVTGCSSSILSEDSVFVSYAPEAIMGLSDTMPFCSGEEIFIINYSIDTISNPLINPIDNYAIEINGSLVYENATMDSILYPLISAGDYWITFVTSNSLGCLDSTSTVITVNQTPEADAGTSISVCPGNELLLDGTASSGGSIFEWSPPGNFINNTVSQPLGIFPETTMVYLEYSNAFCSDIDSVQINIITDLELQAWPDTAICIGESIQIHSQYDAADNPVSIVWLNGDYLSSTIIPDPISTPLNSITYTVAATCGDLIDYEDVTIVVNSLPEVVATDTINAYFGESFILSSTASGNGPFIYSWTPTEYLGCSDCQNTTATPPSDATYFITVIDENNCSAMDSVYLRMGYDCGQYLGLPNIFTPNNDGFNDVFSFVSDAIQDLSYFRIYDRWGRLMYETRDIYGYWDGTYNGVLCDPGVYVYSLQGSCFDGEPFINSGNITLIK